jgi:hypothetical protein
MTKKSGCGAGNIIHEYIYYGRKKHPLPAHPGPKVHHIVLLIKNLKLPLPNQIYFSTIILYIVLPMHRTKIYNYEK